MSATFKNPRRVSPEQQKEMADRTVSDVVDAIRKHGEVRFIETDPGRFQAR
jgi:hypothetical protein